MRERSSRSLSEKGGSCSELVPRKNALIHTETDNRQTVEQLSADKTGGGGSWWRGGKRTMRKKCGSVCQQHTAEDARTTAHYITTARIAGQRKAGGDEG
jgi:hypothetical protein